VAGNGDAFFVVVTGAETGTRMVKSERPRRIEVQFYQRIRPNSHPIQFSHEFRVEAKALSSRQLSTVLPDLRRWEEAFA